LNHDYTYREKQEKPAMKQSLRQIIERQLKELENEIEKRQNVPKKSRSIGPLRQIASKIIMDAASDDVVYQQIVAFARFIAVKTAPEQPIRVALRNALTQYRRKSLKTRDANGFLQEVLNANTFPIYRLEEVTALREAIKNLLYHIHDRIGEKTERCFCEVQNECIVIEEAAAGNPIDACWFAYNLYLHDRGDTTDDVQAAHFLLGNRISIKYLAELLTFAVWLREECSSTSKRKRKRPGPKKPRIERESELEIYWTWLKRTNKINPTYRILQADYAAENNMTPSEMKKLIERSRRYVKRHGLKPPNHLSV
jgi:hypothetical protein